MGSVMFRNYLAAALRNLVRNRLYAAINIIGLAVGFAVALLIGLFVRDEFSYDKWIPGYERIYLLTDTISLAGQQPYRFDTTPIGLAASLKADNASIDEIARLSTANAALRRGDIELNESLYWADPTIFSILKLPTSAGEPPHALAQPEAMVIARNIARKFSGRTAPIGQTIEIARHNSMRVAAII